VEGRLSIDDKHVSICEVAVDNLAADLDLVCNAVSFFLGHVGEEDLLACYFVFNNIGARVHIRTILDQSSQFHSINCGNTLGECKLFSHEDGDSNLVSSKHRVRRDHRPSTEIDAFTHHFHAEHAFFFLEELSNTLLLFINSFLSHRSIHKNICSILELNPFLCCISVLGLIRFSFSFALAH